MATQSSIPAVDIAPLFERLSRSRDVVDRQILAAAAETGFMTIMGFPGDVGAAARRQLLRLFSAPDAVLDKLAGQLQ